LENPRAKQLAAGTGTDTEPEACEPLDTAVALERLGDRELRRPSDA